MEKIDLKKEFKHLYTPSNKVAQFVDVPELNFIMIDGAIEPGKEPGNSPAFAQAMNALYGAAYTLKFKSKLRKENPLDYGVMALEGLWWIEGGEFDLAKKDNWLWTLMIMQPAHITPEMFQAAVQESERKKPNPANARLRFAAFCEGLCVQMMHIGPYTTEPETKDKMLAFAREHGYVFNGTHHEIYIGNPMRASPEKLKTILRYPVQKAA
jgi:hypothetical protein